MKKILMLMAVLVAFMFTGCSNINEESTLYDVFEELRGEAGTNGQNGVDGQSVYELWLDQGNEGNETVFLEWLKGEVGATGDKGATGEAGVCPDCVPEPREDPVPEGKVRITFSTGIQGLTGFNIAHLLDNALVSIEDTTPVDGVIQFDMEITETGSHAVGLQFTK